MTISETNKRKRINRNVLFLLGLTKLEMDSLVSRHTLLKAVKQICEALPLPQACPDQGMDGLSSKHLFISQRVLEVGYELLYNFKICPFMLRLSPFG